MYTPASPNADDVRLRSSALCRRGTAELLHPPAAGLVPEIGKHELRRLKRSVAVAQRHPHPVIAEADDVRSVRPRYVGEEPRVLLHPPAAGLVAEPGKRNCGG